MKVIAAILASALATVAVARPRTMSGGPKAHVTAFFTNDKGEAAVECWEINSLHSRSQTQRIGNSGAVAHTTGLADGADLKGIDVLTIPPGTGIWPPTTGDGVQADWFDLAGSFSLFNVQGGLIDFSLHASLRGMVNDDEAETHIFSLENGDDWFYFEDDTSSNMNAKSGPPPLFMSTMSAGETELLRMRYLARPEHKVIHKGACKFTGVVTPDTSSVDSNGGHSPFTVQVQVQEGL